MNIRQAIKELREQYLEMADATINREKAHAFYVVASDLDNILLVRCPARSGARSDDSKEGEA